MSAPPPPTTPPPSNTPRAAPWPGDDEAAATAATVHRQKKDLEYKLLQARLERMANATYVDSTRVDESRSMTV